MLSDIYETIGHRFFTGLSSPNKALYINCLDSIYAMSEGQISHIHTRERLHQNIESCIAETHAVLYGSDGMEVSDTLSKRASEVMYSLIEYGWLVSEDIEDAFGQNVYLSEPGTALIRFLRALAQPVQKEYTTFIFNMYNALTNRKQWEDNPYALMLKPVYDNATGLYDALQDLNTYLKDIIKRMGSHTTYEELFENLSDYVEGMFLKQYSRLIRQNVHSYGAVIIRVLGEVREEPAMVQKLIDGYKTENDCNDNAIARDASAHWDSLEVLSGKDYGADYVILNLSDEVLYASVREKTSGDNGTLSGENASGENGTLTAKNVSGKNGKLTVEAAMKQGNLYAYVIRDGRAFIAADDVSAYCTVFPYDGKIWFSPVYYEYEETKELPTGNGDETVVTDIYRLGDGTVVSLDPATGERHRYRVEGGSLIGFSDGVPLGEGKDENDDPVIVRPTLTEINEDGGSK